MAQPAKGLPMTAKWDPEKLKQEVAHLKEIEQRPLLSPHGGLHQAYRAGPVAGA